MGLSGTLADLSGLRNKNMFLWYAASPPMWNTGYFGKIVHVLIRRSERGELYSHNIIDLPHLPFLIMVWDPLSPPRPSPPYTPRPYCWKEKIAFFGSKISIISLLYCPPGWMIGPYYRVWRASGSAQSPTCFFARNASMRNFSSTFYSIAGGRVWG